MGAEVYRTSARARPRGQGALDFNPPSSAILHVMADSTRTTEPPGGRDAERLRTARKRVVERLVEEVMNAGRLEVLDELYTPEMAPAARRWIAPFRASFPDVRMETVTLVAEGDTVVGRFVCAGTHLGRWRGHEPTGRRFKVDEVSFFEFTGVRIARAWAIEDTIRRLRQLGLLGATER
jgi:predicted ester cyclase